MDDHEKDHKRHVDTDILLRLGHWVMVDLIPVLLLLAIMLWGMSLIPRAEAGESRYSASASLKAF